MKQIAIILCILTTLGLTACHQPQAFDKPANDVDSKLSETQLYQMGDEAMSKSNWSSAALYFEALDSRFPFGRYSEQAVLDLIFVYNRAEDNASSAATAQRFMHIFPRSRKLDYAYYMKGVAEFEQEHGPLLKYVPIDSALRDQTMSQEAYQDLHQFVRRFPHSAYVPDARQRLLFLRNNFARKELYAARFYMRRGAWVAAINRAGFLIQHYQQAPQAEEALGILVKANRKLGLQKQADEALAILKLNYPGSSYLS